MPSGVYTRTKETKRILSLAHKGQKLSKEHRERIGESLVGKNHPNWKGGISPYPYEFGRIKENIRKRDNHICQLCSKKQDTRKLDVHHIDYNNKNNNPKNLITLCKGCNREVERNRVVWIRIFRRKIKNLQKEKEI